MKTSDAYALYTVLQRIQSEQTTAPVKFGYAVAVNLKRLQEVAEAFDAARTSLIAVTSKKDDNGNPLIENNMFQLDDVDAFNKGIAELQGVDVDISLVKVGIDYLPAQMEPIVVQVLLPMIAEDA